MQKRMDHILYQIFQIIFLKKHGEKIDNPSVRIYVNKIENMIISKKDNKLLMN